ncbi:hypothetical protein [Shewanella sp. GD04112]|uniref:hypothetical protein n=1 Tax=Shewanella sp. GD04112 TaxID=2975434 RepID=UPI002448329A|nr:hypothetical protein [Shewanella sp. GD04112]MDH0450916.1 hypothetical protein [Shewanella sp. GD04112]
MVEKTLGTLSILMIVLAAYAMADLNWSAMAYPLAILGMIYTFKNSIKGKENHPKVKYGLALILLGMVLPIAFILIKHELAPFGLIITMIMIIVGAINIIKAITETSD